MPGGTIPASYEEIIAMLNEIKSDLEALRQDFRRHDHGNTGSYVQAAITIRGSDNSFNGSPETSSTVSRAALPTSPSV